MPPTRVAVIGAGAFGRNHLRVYRELELANPHLVQLAALVEPDVTRRNHFANLYNIPTFASVAELLTATTPGAHHLGSEICEGKLPTIPAATDPALLGTGFSPSIHASNSPGALAPEAMAQPIHAASICVPTIHHASVAEQLLAAQLDILIEKPFAASLAEADHIIALAREHSRIVAIGHLERFNPAVTATLAALNKPMFFEAHRLSIFTPRSLDVDVVLDLMIHDLDIVLSLTDSPVKEVRAVGLAILSRKTDIANVRIEFDSGCVANFTASRVSTEQVRKLRLFQPHQYLSLDFARQELLTISVDPKLIAAMTTHPPTDGILGDAAQPANPKNPEALHPASTASNLSATNTARTPHLSSEMWAGAATQPSGPHSPTTPAAVPHAAPDAAGGPPVPAGMHHPTAGLSLTRADIPRDEPLRLELENFLHSVRTRTAPRVPAEAGRAALALALEINAQIAAHALRAGLA
jgi:predicted dehydrogenase